jgi:putative ATPase
VDTDDLFDFPIGMPLAARMRPRNLGEFVGQSQVLGDSGVLAQYLDPAGGNQAIPSMIFYGPPGTGKTTLARLLANSNERRFIEVSAINSSIADLRSAMQTSVADIQAGRDSAIVFVDEIHRFSKVQQESLLKAVEDGEIVLIGATTENPSFALTSAILSRAAVIELVNIQEEDLVSLLNSALESERGLEGKVQASTEVLQLIASQSGGDARKALTVLETAANRVIRAGLTDIKPEDVSATMNKALNRYDATGDQHYDIISAFIKSVRGSDADAALHWLSRMIVGGEDPRFIARRLVILASEDIGLADPNALVIANATMQVVAQIGMPEGRIPLASTTIYLALAPKSNRAYEAINSAIADVEGGLSPAVPRHLRSAALGKDPGYEYPHDLEAGISAQEYVPAVAAKKYYVPKAIGFENTLIERISRILPFLRRKP